MTSSLARLIRSMPIPAAGSGEGSLRTLTRGELIYMEGVAADTIYCVESGEVALFVATDRGIEFDLFHRGAGECFGMDGLLGGRHLVAARSTGPSRIRAWSVKSVRERLEAEPALLWSICAELLDELAQLKRLVTDLGGRTTVERLAVFLVEESGKNGGDGNISLPWGAKGEVARRLIMKQETLSRLLHRFAEQGLIELQPHGIRILQPEGLRRLTDE